MRLNLPVTQREYDSDDSVIVVSTTDAQRRITHCNRSFVEISGYDYDDMMGQPHDPVRHPDMPPEAFKDMWSQRRIQSRKGARYAFLRNASTAIISVSNFATSGRSASS